MQPFDYQPRIRTIFGRGAFQRLGSLARELGAARALLICDNGIVEAGHAGTARRLLSESGVRCDGFHDFEGFGTRAAVEAACAMAESLDADLIVGLGGGATLELGKAVHSERRAALQLAVGIPTTAGSGSEAHGFFSLTDPQTGDRVVSGDSSTVYQIALLDPELPGTAPRHVAALAGFDAIAHAIETAVSTRRTPLSDTFSHRAWRLLSDGFERVLVHDGDQDAQAALLLGAYLAGTAIDTSALGAAHACASPLTARYGIGHGLALAMMLPHVVRWNGEVARSRFEALVGAPRRRARDEDPEETLARRVSDLADAAGLAVRLRDAGIDEPALTSLAVAAAADWSAPFNPRPLNAAGALEIYRAAW